MVASRLCNTLTRDSCMESTQNRLATSSSKPINGHTSQLSTQQKKQIKDLKTDEVDNSANGVCHESPINGFDMNGQGDGPQVTITETQDVGAAGDSPLSPEDQSLIRDLDAKSLLDYLHKQGALSAAELAELSELEGEVCSRYLLNCLQKQTAGRQLLVNALRHSGQLSLASRLDSSKRIDSRKRSRYVGQLDIHLNVLAVRLPRSEAPQSVLENEDETDWWLGVQDLEEPKIDPTRSQSETQTHKPTEENTDRASLALSRGQLGSLKSLTRVNGSIRQLSRIESDSDSDSPNSGLCGCFRRKRKNKRKKIKKGRKNNTTVITRREPTDVLYVSAQHCKLETSFTGPDLHVDSVRLNLSDDRQRSEQTSPPPLPDPNPQPAPLLTADERPHYREHLQRITDELRALLLHDEDILNTLRKHLEQQLQLLVIDFMEPVSGDVSFCVRMQCVATRTKDVEHVFLEHENGELITPFQRLIVDGELCEQLDILDLKLCTNIDAEHYFQALVELKGN